MIETSGQSVYSPIIAQGVNVSEQSIYVVLLNPIVTVSDQTVYAVLFPEDQISGTVEYSEESDTGLSNSILTIGANSSTVMANDTLVSTIGSAITGTVTYSEDFDTLLSNGQLNITVTSETSESDTMVSEVQIKTPILAIAAVTESSDQLSTQAYSATMKLYHQDVDDVMVSNSIVFSQNTNSLIIRRGYEANLPNLDVAELGYTIDTNRLFLGTQNGNVEILTELSWEAFAETHGRKLRESNNRDFNGSYMPSGILRTPDGPIVANVTISFSAQGLIAIMGNINKGISLSMQTAGYIGDEPSGWGESWGDDWGG